MYVSTKNLFAVAFVGMIVFGGLTALDGAKESFESYKDEQSRLHAELVR